MGGDQVSIVVGVGCRANVPAEAFVALIAQALAGRTATALATPAFKADDAGLRKAAQALRLPVWPIDDAALARAQSGCVTRSPVAERETGFASVAEAAALAARPGATLLLPRITDGRVTVALAEYP